MSGTKEHRGVASSGIGGPSPSRADFRVFRQLGTRWMDNDVYGHVNNVVYYSYFDTAVNGWLLEATGTDIRRLPAIGIVAETSCRFLKSISFPDKLDIGLGVERLGERSIVYRLGVFRHGETELLAHGRFVHVYVDAETRRPTPIPALIQNAVRRELI
ncbi:MAG: acyl-CoA thioesterase [Steroidobacteraceae bacterium]|nr:acyl-CoA thioesterase [Steroidobacteraceae bacterium]